MSSSISNYGFNIRKTKHQFFNNLHEKCTSFMLHEIHASKHLTTLPSQWNLLCIDYQAHDWALFMLLFKNVSLSYEIFLSQFCYPLLICFSLSALFVLTSHNPQCKFFFLLWHKSVWVRTINYAFFF